MFSVIGFILIFIFIIIFAGLSIISRVLRTIFGLGKRSSSYQSRNSEHYDNSTVGNSEDAFRNTSRHKKIFDKEEGEYVDFEEIKDKEE